MTLTCSGISQVKQTALARLWQTASISLLIHHVEGAIQVAASCFPKSFFLILYISIATATTHSVEVHCETYWRQKRIWEMCFLPVLVPFCSFSQVAQSNCCCGLKLRQRQQRWLRITSKNSAPACNSWRWHRSTLSGSTASCWVKVRPHRSLYLPK